MSFKQGPDSFGGSSAGGAGNLVSLAAWRAARATSTATTTTTTTTTTVTVEEPVTTISREADPATHSKVLSIREALEEQKRENAIRTIEDTVLTKILTLYMLHGLRDMTPSHSSMSPMEMLRMLRRKDREHENVLSDKDLVGWRFFKGETRRNTPESLGQWLVEYTERLNEQPPLPKESDHRLFQSRPTLLTLCPEVAKNHGLIDRIMETYDELLKMSSSGELHLEGSSFVHRASDPKEYGFEIWALFRWLERHVQPQKALKDFDVIRAQDNTKEKPLVNTKSMLLLTATEIDGILTRADMAKLEFDINPMRRDSESKRAKGSKVPTMTIRKTDLYRPIDAAMTMRGDRESNVVSPRPIAEVLSHVRDPLRVMVGRGGPSPIVKK